MNGVMLALAAAAAWGVAEFLAGVRARTVALPVVLVVSQLVGFGSLMAVLAAGGALGAAATALDARALLLASAAGVLGLAALGFLYLAMTRGSLAVSAPVAAGSAVVPVMVGLARGEALAPRAAVGVGLALAGAIAGAVPAQGQSLTGGRAGLPAAAASAIAGGLFYTALNDASAKSPVAATLVNRVAACTVVILWALWVRRRRDVSSPLGGAWSLAVIGVVGVIDTAAELLFASASSTRDLSVVSPLASLYPVVTVVLAVVMLREPLRPVPALGVLSALGGVLLLAGHG